MKKTALLSLIFCLSLVCSDFASGSAVTSPELFLKVDKISDLRKIAGGSAKRVVQVLGYYLPGDGGGGPLRYWNATSTCTDNGGSCIDPSAAGPGRWIFSIDDGAVDVRAFGAKGDGLADDTAAIVKTIETGKAVTWPAGVYKITSTLTGSTGAWYGAGQGLTYSSTPGPGTTIIKCVGTNGGQPFIVPPDTMEGFHFDGVDKAATGIVLGSEGAFTAWKKWRKITIRNFDLAWRGYNWFSSTFEDIVIQGNHQGIRINPTDGAGDDGYFTSTSWKNIHIADNDVYGLYVDTPLGAKTWTGENIVIERNATSGGALYQAYIRSAGWNIRGLYLEGTSAVPAIKMHSAYLTVTDGFVNNTGGIDLGNNDNTIIGVRFNFAQASDVITGIGAPPNKIFLDFTSSSLKTDLPTAAAASSKIQVNLRRVETAGKTFIGHVQKLSIGNPVGGIYASELTETRAWTKQVSGTVPANGLLTVISNTYNYGIWSNTAHAVGNIAGNYPGLICTVLPADTGSVDFFRVILINTTASPVVLTDVKINIIFIKSDATQL